MRYKRSRAAAGIAIGEALDAVVDPPEVRLLRLYRGPLRIDSRRNWPNRLQPGQSSGGLSEAATS
ncbi:hypothetical protein Ae717Ps2_6291c [Pseudonocardia sp. Ae717_Ps2]|nr:hypothetical protein Ae717Ps2_6149c [Pseudonocardia sp. Ae717_Ps2]OLM28695.1 hypothetical protein Ae717Ps2_6291c [Pseudonocardia sp. Ae717_Ps2]